MNNSGINMYNNQGKAISGRRHSLTQFIKYFGLNNLRKLSYAKISRFSSNGYRSKYSSTL